MISDSFRVDASNKKKFIIVNHGLPIDPDYNILTEPKSVFDSRSASKSGELKKVALFNFLIIWINNPDKNPFC